MSKYAIYNYKFEISSFGLTCFVKPRLASTYLCSFCSQVSKGERKWGTWKRRLLDVPHQNVHKTFRFGRLSVFLNWTKYERPFMNVFRRYIFGPCVYRAKQFKMATSKTWTRILDPNPEKLGPWKPWPGKTLAQNNLDPEKSADSQKLGSYKTWSKYRIKMYV